MPKRKRKTLWNSTSSICWFWSIFLKKEMLDVVWCVCECVCVRFGTMDGRGGRRAGVMIDVACYGEGSGLTVFMGVVVVTLTAGGSSARRHFELWFCGKREKGDVCR